MVFACVAALAESAEKEQMGVLRVNKAFDIQYSKLENGYTLSIYMQNDMLIAANVISTDTSMPRIGLMIAFNDAWANTERLNDVSDEDLEEIKDSFYEEYDNITFDTKETEHGTKLLIANIEGGQDAYIYTIYKGHEIELHLVPGDNQAG